MRTLGPILQPQYEKRAEYIARLNGALIVAIKSGDCDRIHHAARMLRLAVGRMEREMKEL
jgi:hypothetical protein